MAKRPLRSSHFEAVLAAYDPHGELPYPDRIAGFVMDSEEDIREAERWERMTHEERMAELLEDPDVQAVLEAAEGREPVRS